MYLSVSIDLLVQQPFLQFSASGTDCELERNVVDSVDSLFNLIFILQGRHPDGDMCWSWSALPCWPLAKARRRQTHCAFQFSHLCFNSQFDRSFSTYGLILCTLQHVNHSYKTCYTSSQCEGILLVFALQPSTWHCRAHMAACLGKGTGAFTLRQTVQGQKYQQWWTNV